MNYCLNALIDKDWVKVRNFSESKYKFGYVYLLTARAIAEKAALKGHFLQRKHLEYEALRDEIESLSGEWSIGTTGPELPAGTEAPGVYNFVAGRV
jgi:hypothetical protein